MKRKLNHWLLRVSVFLICFLTFGVNFSTAEETVYVLSYSPGTLFHQLVKKRVKDVYERAGFKVRFEALPHLRSLESANSGKVDGDVGRISAIESKYPHLRRVDVKLMDLNGAAYTLHDDINSYSEDIIQKYRIGSVLGVRWTKRMMQGLQVTTVKDYSALFQVLLYDRVDVVLATEASADAVLQELGGQADGIRKLKPFILSAPIYHYVYQKNEAIIPSLEKAITELVQEGFWDEFGKGNLKP
ncbi:ABC transporter substrate-binding protein [Desulfopila sp. IMCC35008]|uniref:substrate-binding periplasmic protein n=1 Tax=Desulfopila sp. IMCC35008 TaxID=2653858 RepID=UPI0013D5BBC5|nr:transporter substrate-binding domain-containing protein [Desulfopila sp. IMCC35008]